MSDIKNVPELRFPQFTGDWKQTGLSKLGTFKNGLNKSKEDFGFGSPFINLMDVFGKSSINNKQYGLVNASEKELALYNLLKGDVVFIRSSVKREGVGETVLVTEDLQSTTYSGFLIRFRSSNNELNFLFKKYCFKIRSFRSSLISLSSTSANTNINQESLNTLKIKYPSLEEQQKIADFLSSVDKKIEQLTEKHRLLTEYKKGVMQQIFTQQIRFKDNQGNDYPEWEEKKLGQLGSIVGGGTPETSQSSYWEGDIQWFTPTEIKQKYMSKSIRTISEDGLKKSSAKLLPVGALLLTTRATIADLSIATKECTTNQGFQSIIVNDQNNNEFLYYWILNNRKQFIRKASGSTFPEISKKEIEKIEGIFPLKEEQQKIANFLTEIDQKIDQAWSILEQTKAFKKGLLQKMFV